MKKVKASFTISGQTLKDLDRLVGRNGNRSAFVEEALQAAIKQRERQLRDERDIALVAKYAEDFQREADKDMELLVAIYQDELKRRRKGRK